MAEFSSTTRAFEPLTDSNWHSFKGNFIAYAKRKKFAKILLGTTPRPSFATTTTSTATGTATPGGTSTAAPASSSTAAALSEAEQKKLDDWDELNDQGSGELYLYLSDSQKVHVRGLEDDLAKMWTSLETLHVQKRPATRFNAYSALLSIHKLDTETLPSLITRVEAALQNCKDVADTNMKVDTLYEDLASMALIRALPASYSSFVSTAVLLPDFSYAKVKEAFILEEHNRRANEAGPSFIASVASQQKGRGKQNSLCDFCGAPGHVQSTCFKYTKFKKQAEEERKANAQSRANAKQSASVSVTEFAGHASALHSSSPRIHSDSSWLADTGATSHMTPYREWFNTYTQYRIPIAIADGTIIYSAGIGSVCFMPSLPKNQDCNLLEFNRVLHVPDLNKSLLSVLWLSAEKHIEILIKDRLLSFVRNSVCLFTASIRTNYTALLDGTVVLPSISPTLPVALAASTLPLDLSLWHRRFNHLNHADVKKLISGQMVTGMKLNSNSQPDPICEPCLAGKSHRTVNKVALHRSKHILGLVHSDLCGPLPVATPQGHRYFITFITDNGRFFSVQFLKNKSEAFTAFKHYKA